MRVRETEGDGRRGGREEGGRVGGNKTPETKDHLKPQDTSAKWAPA